MKRYWIETYGCQMNVAESEALEIDLRSRGWTEAETAEEADIVLLQTCSVRQTAEERIWGRIGYFKHIKEKRSQDLVVVGCMAERLKEKIYERYPEVDLVVGNFAKQELAGRLDRFKKNDEHLLLGDEKTYHFSPLHAREGAHHAYIPIMHGCDNFCTYCIVPHVRGRELSRPPEDIIREIRKAEKLGVRELSLLGQNVNSYRFDEARGILDFPGLLRRILDSSRHIEWFRFITSHPKDVPSGLIELIAQEKRLCSHVHLPIQHASDRILSSMNRGYTREDYIRIVKTLRERIPDIALSTDILVGFPGEEEEDFEVLLDVLRRLEFDDAFMYYFNPREGTPAANFSSQVEHETKLDRLSRLISLQRSITLDARGRRIGKIDKVMIDGTSKKNSSEMRGHSERDEPVVIEGGAEMRGKIYPVRLEELSGLTYKGRIDGEE